MTEFREIWTEDIRHIHAVLADAENIRYTREDSTTIRVEAVSTGLTGPPKKIRHVEVYGTAEDGGHVTDRFLIDAHELPDEIADLIYPAALTRLMAAVIEADTEPPAPGRPQEPYPSREPPAAGRAGTASPPGELIRSGQAAAILNVSITTLIGWDRQGILPAARTKGNHRRYRTAEVRALRDRLTAEGTVSHREAASTAGVKPVTIERWAKTGKLTPVTTPLPGKRQRYRETEVKTVIETGIRGSRTDVKTGDIARMRDDDKMTWAAIIKATGMSRSALAARYSRHKKSHARAGPRPAPPRPDPTA